MSGFLHALPESVPGASLNSADGSQSSWIAILKEADQHYYGLKGHTQDYAKAFELYQEAARLGAPAAYLRLGDIYMFGAGVEENEKKALEYYTEGARRGNYFCYGEISKHFLSNGEIENARRAFAGFVAGGEADHWTTYAQFKNQHIQAMLFPLIRSASVLSYVEPAFLSLIAKYAASLLELAKRFLSHSRTGSITRASLLKVVATLETMQLAPAAAGSKHLQ